MAVRRSAEDRIKAIEAQIEALKQRRARKLIPRDPALKHLHAAVRTLPALISRFITGRIVPVSVPSACAICSPRLPGFART